MVTSSPYHKATRRSPGEGHGNPLHILVWRIPWTEEPGGLQTMGSQRVGHDQSDLAHTHTKDGNVVPSLQMK